MAGPAGRRAMTPPECSRLLRDIGWGVIAVTEAHEARAAAVPVAVPMAYAWDGERLYLTMTDGRKLRALERNPHLCLTITDVHSFVRWRSVLVVGRGRWIAAERERARATEAFLAQRHEWGGDGLTRGDAERLAAAHVLVLEPDEIHGFESGMEEGTMIETMDAPATADAEATTPDHANEAMDAVRRIVRALRGTDTRAEAELGVGAAQLFVLREIEKAGVLTVGELAHRTATAQSSVSEVLARLIARKLVTRGTSATDRRRAAITLSAHGQALLARAPETVQERLIGAFRRLSVERQRALAAGLDEWIRESGLEGEAATMFFEG